jgi:hypothetical protein
MSTTTSPPRTVLGRCAHAQSNFSRFEPLLSCTAERWDEVADPVLSFPEVGRVFSVEPVTLNADVGSFWLFTTETNTRYEPRRSHDTLLVRDPRPALQVVDCSGLKLESARRELVEVGLPISRVLTAEAVIRLEGDLCVRLKLLKDEATGRRRADVDGLEDVALMRYRPQIAAGATVDGVQFVLPGREPHEIVDHVDWSPDNDFLERTLKRVRRIVRDDGRGVDVISLSNSAIEMLSHYLRRAGPASGRRDSLHRMRRRLEDFLPNFKANMLELDAIVAALETYRPVAARISYDVGERRVLLDAELRDSLEPVIRKELAERNSVAVAELERVLQDTAAAETTRAELLLQVETLTRSANELKTALGLELAGVHDALEGASTDAASTVSAIVRHISTALTDASVATDLTPAATPPWGLGVTTDATLIGADLLRERLNAEADRWGMEATDLIIFDALLRAGELVVLVDQQDRFQLEAYARSVCGGRLRKLVVDPTMIGLDDLWRQAGSGAPTPFARAWTAARAHPHQMVLLAIEYLNVAPLGFWLPVLAAELHGPDRPRNLLVAATLAATGAGHQENLAFLRTTSIPLLSAPSTDAWMRLALRVADREAPEPATILNASQSSPLSVEDTTCLMAELTGISTLRPSGAGRAVKVMQSASYTMVREDALRLAMDVGRLTAGESESPAILKTPAVARGVHGLRDLLHRNNN